VKSYNNKKTQGRLILREAKTRRRRKKKKPHDFLISMLTKLTYSL